MEALKDVREINCIIATEELVVTHFNEITMQLVNSTFRTDHGQTFQTERRNGSWELNISKGQVNADFTEIRTRKTGSEVNFDDFNLRDNPTLTFIGITDIRDGLTAPSWKLAFGLSPISIHTNATEDALTIRKKTAIN